MLEKALYGSKQAPRSSHSTIDDYWLSLGFVRSESEVSLYVDNKETGLRIVSIYVDDILDTRNNVCLFEYFKREIMQVFEMTVLGIRTYFL